MKEGIKDREEVNIPIIKEEALFLVGEHIYSCYIVGGYVALLCWDFRAEFI